MLIRRRPDLCLPSFSPPCLRLARALPTHTLHTPHTLTNTHSYSALPPKTKQIQKKTQKGHGEGHPHPGAAEQEPRHHRHRRARRRDRGGDVEHARAQEQDGGRVPRRPHLPQAQRLCVRILLFLCCGRVFGCLFFSVVEAHHSHYTLTLIIQHTTNTHTNTNKLKRRHQRRRRHEGDGRRERPRGRAAGRRA